MSKCACVYVCMCSQVHTCVYKDAVLVCMTMHVCKDSVNASISVHVCMNAQEHAHMCVRCCACMCECVCMFERMLCMCVHVYKHDVCE